MCLILLVFTVSALSILFQQQFYEKFKGEDISIDLFADADDKDNGKPFRLWKYFNLLDVKVIFFKKVGKLKIPNYCAYIPLDYINIKIYAA